MDKKVDLSDMDPQFLKPYEKTITMATGVLSRKTVRMCVKLPRRSFIRREDIPVDLHIENNAPEDIHNISAYVFLTVVACSGKHEGDIDKKFHFKGIKVKQDGVLAGESVQRHLTVPLDFSHSDAPLDNILLPMSPLDCYSNLLHAVYQLRIKIKRGRMHRNFTTEIPIWVGNKFQ